MFDPYNSNPYENNNAPKIKIDYKRTRASSKKHGIGTVNAGGAVIIIIFVVLCLTIFGLLSFATAFADKKLADRNLESIARYYRADAEAELKLAQAYDALCSKIMPVSGPEGFFDEDFVKSAISDIFEGSIFEIHGVTAHFKTDMGNSRDSEVQFFLSVGVEFQFDEASKELSYKITEWKITSDRDFDYDDDILDL